MARFVKSGCKMSNVRSGLEILCIGYGFGPTTIP